MPWSETLPQFSLAGTLLTVLLLFFAAFGEPFLGRRAFAWLSRRRDTDANALVRVHAVTMGVHVLWGVLVAAVLFTSPNLAAADLGFRLPHALGPVAGGALGGLLALVALWVLANGLPPWLKDRLPSKAPKGRKRGGRRAAAGRPASLPEPERDRWLLIPYTRNERLAAVGAAVTGGVCAELLYRGLFIVLLASMGVPLWIGAVLSVVLFAVAYLYQGWWGLVSAGASGTLFAVLYLGTGSLWVPVLVHVALNLRSLAFPPAELREESYAYDDYEDDGDDDPEPPTTAATPPHGIPAEPSPSLGGTPFQPGPEGPNPGPGPVPAAPARGAAPHGGPQSRPDLRGVGGGPVTNDGPPAWGTPAEGSPSFGGTSFQPGAPAAEGPNPGAAPHSGPQSRPDAHGVGGAPVRNDGPPAWGTPVEGSPSFGGTPFQPGAPGAGVPNVGSGPQPAAPSWGTPAEGSPSFGGTPFQPGAPGADGPNLGAAPGAVAPAWGTAPHGGPQARPDLRGVSGVSGTNDGPPVWGTPAEGSPSFGGAPLRPGAQGGAPGWGASGQGGATGAHGSGYGRPGAPYGGGAEYRPGAYGPGGHRAEAAAWSGDALGDDFLGADPAHERGDGDRPLYPDERIDRRYGDL